MVSDANLAELHRAEALLMLGRVDEVESTCAALVAYFRHANMVTGALTAVAFLKEAAAKRRITRQQIEHVRKYVEKLDSIPHLAFTPPPEDD